MSDNKKRRATGYDVKKQQRTGHFHGFQNNPDRESIALIEDKNGFVHILYIGYGFKFLDK